MKELSQIFHALSAGQSFALATLVKVEGSSYRRAGARLLWNPEGVRIGSISGGCLEDDVIERCRAVLTTGKSQTVIYDTTNENDLVWGVGLGCNGIVQVLVEKLTTLPAPLALIAQAWERREAAVLATVFRAPPEISLGAAFAISESSHRWHAHVNAEQPKRFASLATRCLEVGRSTVTALSAGQGSFEVFFEYLPPPPHVAIFGAGNDAQPLVRFVKGLGWRASVIDPRPAYATAARFPEADLVSVFRPEEAVRHLKLDTRSLAVVMTHHYVHDVPLLRTLLPLPLPYVGLLGPKKRAEKILNDLASGGLSITAEMRSRLHAPIGLDIGANTPEEVALAIVSEMQAVMRGRDGRPLRERARPIHE